ncbi:MAG TPA: heavy-metal-associated domain-containing protein [Anaerolineaceae bacterium]|nr:heavy-metal-associated domain-containing protein [Anaerolineaceae bacterium]
MSIVKIVFKIPDMHCSACVMKLECLEDDLPGVRMVKASYQKQSMLVEYDDSNVSEEEIRNAIQGLGYTVEKC